MDPRKVVQDPTICSSIYKFHERNASYTQARTVGIVATEKIALDLLNSRKHGKKALHEFATTDKTNILKLHTFSDLKPQSLPKLRENSG